MLLAAVFSGAKILIYRTLYDLAILINPIQPNPKPDTSENNTI
jgi:hypothetical protein